MYIRTLRFILFFSLVFSAFSCNLFKKIDDGSGTTIPPDLTDVDPNFVGVESVFDVQFVQNGLEVPMDEGIVELKKGPFSIYVNMQDLDGVYLNASTEYDEKYIDDNKFDNLDMIYPKIMAEPAFNKDRELYLSNNNYSYWFYDPNLDWHRLSDVQIMGDKVVGEKVVHNLVFPEDNRSIKVENANQDLFLFFFALQDKLEDGFQIRQRQYIKVEWD